MANNTNSVAPCDSKRNVAKRHGCSVHETAARQRKTERLVAAIDSQVGARAWTQSLQIARWLDQLTDDGWATLALAAGVRAPSDVTRAAVVNVYVSRNSQRRAS